MKKELKHAHAHIHAHHLISDDLSPLKQSPPPYGPNDQATNQYLHPSNLSHVMPEMMNVEDYEGEMAPVMMNQNQSTYQ